MINEEKDIIEKYKYIIIKLLHGGGKLGRA
jgi:hypothetical protein